MGPLLFNIFINDNVEVNDIANVLCMLIILHLYQRLKLLATAKIQNIFIII